jgi:hypothetical protein
MKTLHWITILLTIVIITNVISFCCGVKVGGTYVAEEIKIRMENDPDYIQRHEKLKELNERLQRLENK